MYGVINMKQAMEIIKVALAKQEKNFDSVFVIVGKERVGKSMLMLHLAEECDADITDISLDRDGFINILVNSQPLGFACLDEAGDALFSRDAMTTFNKLLVKAFMVIGGQRLITFLVLPDFFSLDTYFRKHRVRGLFHVIKRGRYQFHDQKAIQKIINKGDRYIPVKPYGTDSFPDYKGRLLKPYQQLKSAKIKNTLKEMGEDLKAGNAPKKPITNAEAYYHATINTKHTRKEIADFYKCSTQNINKSVKRSEKIYGNLNN